MTTLSETGCLVIPRVLTGPELSSARERAAFLTDAGADGVITSKPGKGADEAINREVLLRWVRPQEGRKKAEPPPSTSQGRGVGLESSIVLLRSVPSLLESGGYGRSESHQVPNLCRVAMMPGTGATYRPHRDATIYSFWELGVLGWIKSRGYQRRVLTSILYLNDEDWAKAEGGGDEDGSGSGDEKGAVAASAAVGLGGCLRLHVHADPTDETGDKAKLPPVDVPPNGGTLVIFDSKRMLHEVLPTFRDRLTITSWVVGDSHA